MSKTKTRSVSLPPGMITWIEEQIKDGRYVSFSEAVREAISVLMETRRYIPSREI